MVSLNLDIPEDFFKGEERDGYYVSPEMKKVWAVELDLLSEFMRVCQKHNIRFYGDAGTILGAARHGGMIPWDDDIDVMLFRKDYERLCKIAPQEFSHPYFFQTEETDPGSRRGHAQLRNSETTGILNAERSFDMKFNQGIFLDIFPIDDIPDDEELFSQMLSRLVKVKKRTDGIIWLTDAYLPAKKLWKRPFKAVLHKGLSLCHITYHSSYNTFTKELRQWKFPDSRRVAKLVLHPFKPRRIWQRSDFADVVYLPFEMLEIPVPIGYKNILRQFYGEWEKYVVGTASHGGVFFDTERPYTYYTEGEHVAKR